MINDLLAMLEAAKGLPEYLIVPPGWDPKTLPPECGDGRLAGIKVVVSPHLPPGTAYLIAGPDKAAPIRQFDPLFLPLRRESVVKVENVT